MLKSVCLFDGV